MHKMMLDLPSRLVTERLLIRSYGPGDGAWYFAMGQKNLDHLRLYEAENPIMGLQSVEDAEVLVREFAAAWASRSAFFFGAFEKASQAFVAQIYVGPTNWDLPEFEIGYFVDREREGQGYVVESVRAVVSFAFQSLQARRLFLQTADTNERSYRVAERSGFTREGHLRQNKKHPDGRVTGTLVYGLLREEFDAG